MNRDLLIPRLRRAAAFILAGSISALLSTPLSAQTTITYTNGQTDTNAYSVTAPNDPTTLTIASGAATQSGILSGTGGVIKAGAGTLTLSGKNTFNGAVQVNAGALGISHDTNLGATGNPVTLSGSTLQTSSTYSSHPLAVSSAGTVDTSRGFTTLQNAALTGSGVLTKTGGGTFFLAASSGNIFSGDITLAIDGGTFQIGSSVSSRPMVGASLPGMTAGNTIAVNRGAIFSIRNGNSATSSAGDRLGTPGSRPAVTLSGGTFNLTGAPADTVVTQTLGPLNLTAGTSTIEAITTSPTGSPVLVFSSFNRSNGAFAHFNGSPLGTASGGGRIFFTSEPTLVGGGGLAGTTTVSVIPGARAGNNNFGADLATYGATGVRPLASTEYNNITGNNINGAGATENVKLSDAAAPAFTALSGPKTINALVTTAAVGSTWAMGNTLTLTSGQFIHNSGSTLNISSGALTAGTGAAGSVDLDISILSGPTTIGANLTDNGSTVVSLVKNGTIPLTLASATNNSYSGGTVVNDGSLSTGSVSNRRYLGTGAVLVNSGGNLTLTAPGATSFSGSVASPTYTIKSGGSIFMGSSAPASNEFFKVESGGIIGYGTLTVAAGLDLDTNLDAAPGSIFAEGSPSANVFIKKGGVAIQSAVTTPTYYFGTATLNLQENITVGAGTPWLGLSNNASSTGYGGASSTNNTITANSDFTLLAARTPYIAPTLTLGGGASATNIVKIATPNGNVNANVVGSVVLNNDNSQYGSAGNRVKFQVTSGAMLTASTANAQGIVAGAAIAPAEIIVQNGGTLGLTATGVAGFNSSVMILAGGMFTQSQASLTGTGILTHSEGSILNLANTAAVSGATQGLGTVPGTIVRLGVTGLLAGTSTAGVTQFDSRLSDAAVYEVSTSPSTMGAASAATDSLFTLSANGGIGGILTNDNTTRTLSGTTGLIAIGSGGSTFAATTGTVFTVAENFALGANTLTIGSTQSYDGNPKLGAVSLASAPGSNTGSAGSVIAVGAANTLVIGAADQIPDATGLRIDNGGTVSISSFSDTVASFQLIAGGLTGTTGAITSTTPFDLRAGSVSAILAGTVGVNKTTVATATLSGTNSYSGDTAIGGGTLTLTGNGSFANSPTIAIASGATLNVAAVAGGANHDGTRFAVMNGQTLKGTGTVVGAIGVSNGGTLAPGNSIGTLAIESLSLTGADSVFELEIDLGLTPAADLLNVTGSITLAGSTLDLSLFNLSPMGLPETFLFAANDASDAVVGTFDTIIGVPDGYLATIDYAFAGTDSLGRVGNGNDIAVTLSVAAVPEPATIAWGLAVGILAIGRRRRVRR